jgi:hypothetical protein
LTQVSGRLSWIASAILDFPERGIPAPGGPIAWDSIFAERPVDDRELHRHAADLGRLLAD